MRGEYRIRRIFQNEDDEQPNEEGLKFYDDVFDEMRKHNIELLVTILHLVKRRRNLPIRERLRKQMPASSFSLCII